jgi:phosphoglycolate phosphatase-like HAD superfamily hydrolase
VNAVAIHLDVLGDTGPLWDDWLDDARRRYRVDGADLDSELPNWRRLLERFAEDRAPVYFRRDADVAAALSRLHEGGVKLGVFTDAPQELARVALAHLGADRRIDAVEAGTGAKERLVERLGGAPVIEARDELLALRLS